MPTISRFYGIIIQMYYLPKEHNPPHIHIVYQDIVFAITISDMRIISGEQHPPARALSMVKEWIELHQQELLDMWDTQDLHPIKPLD